MKVCLTSDSIAWLRSHNILFNDGQLERLKPGMHITFPAGLKLEPYVGIYAGHTLCNLGSFSYSNSPLSQHLKIGRYCSIAGGVQTAFWRHPVSAVSTSVFAYNKNISVISKAIADTQEAYENQIENKQKPEAIIRNDVWVGTNAFLMPGITIENGAIIAAGSVVTKDVGPYEIVGGNPARVIKKRFDDKVIADLLDSRWWDYKFTDFRALDIASPQAFLSKFAEIRPSLTPYSPEKIAIEQIPL